MKTEFYSSEMLSEYLSDKTSYSLKQIKILDSYIEKGVLHLQYEIRTDVSKWSERNSINCFELIDWMYHKLKYFRL